MTRPMKDSGIEWIGEIPEDWRVDNIRHHFSFGKGLPITKENLQEYGISVISYGQIHSKTNTGTTVKDNMIRYVDRSYLESNPDSLVKKNDFIFADTSEDLEGCGNCVYNDRDDLLFAGYHTIILRNKQKQSQRYCAYLFKSDAWRKQIRERVTGVKLFSISQKILRELTILYPPISEQTRIADFLDEKCAEIDGVIEKTQASIEEYKKLKQAVITQAVTKGIRPNRPMKDSGIEWIGLLPESWSVLSLKYLCTMQSGNNLVSEQISDTGEYPVYGGNGQRGYFEKYNCEGKKLLVGRQGALCGNVHRVDGKFWATEHAVITENTRFCYLDFLYYLLLGMNLNQYASSTAAQPGLAVSTIQNVKTCLPSMAEQQEIAEYLDNKIPQIEMLIQKKERFLEELNNYKKSLIFEYVTGKKEVSAS